MKKIFFLCLVAALMLVSGCEYSVTHTSDASLSVDSNGKVDTSASSSVYTERTENGKTVNNSASVSVGSKGASANAGTSSAKQSVEGLSYTVEDADLRKGEAELDGYFTNNGSQPIKITSITLYMEFYDEKGKLIWADESEIKNINLVVKPGGKEIHDFVITNPDAPDFKGKSFDMKYRMQFGS